MKAFLKTRIVLGAFLATVLLATAPSAAAADKDFSGHYEIANRKAKTAFELDVKQTGARAEIAFSASLTSGEGAAPDGSGSGEVTAAGVLSFAFQDSFGNEGTATLTPANGLYRLKLDLAKVNDPRCLRVYDDCTLRKVSAKKPRR